MFGNLVVQGTARRKKKVIPKSTAADDKKIQMAVKKIGVNAIPGIEEVKLASLFTK